MRLSEFLFSYKINLKFFLIEKKYFKAVSKFFGYPYKYLVEIIKIFFSINKVNLDSSKFDHLNKYFLYKLFIFFNSDKGSKINLGNKIINGHNYSASYEKYFGKIKLEKKIKILEIGSLIGSSATSFLKYFEDVEIYCLDVNPFQIKYRSKHIRKFYINTRNKKILNEGSNYFDFEFDIIIDDGSHNKRDQIITLNYFLPKLKTKGIYVVEDTCEYLRIPELNDDKLDYGINDFIKSIFETGNHFSEYLTLLEQKNIQNMIKSYNLEKGNFVYNNQSLPEIIFLEKK